MAIKNKTFRLYDACGSSTDVQSSDIVGVQFEGATFGEPKTIGDQVSVDLKATGYCVTLKDGRTLGPFVRDELIVTGKLETQIDGSPDCMCRTCGANPAAYLDQCE